MWPQLLQNLTLPWQSLNLQYWWLGEKCRLSERDFIFECPPLRDDLWNCGASLAELIEFHRISLNNLNITINTILWFLGWFIVETWQIKWQLHSLHGQNDMSKVQWPHFACLTLQQHWVLPKNCLLQYLIKKRCSLVFDWLKWQMCSMAKTISKVWNTNFHIKMTTK